MSLVYSRKKRFADGELGIALDTLFESSGELRDERAESKVLRVIRLLDWNPGGDSVHEMVHHDLDYLETLPPMNEAVVLLRNQLLPRRHPSGAFKDDEPPQS